MGRNGFHMGSTSDIAYGAVMLATIAIAIGVIGWVLPVQKPDIDILATHVHHPNTMLLETPSWTPDPFTTTSTTPVGLPGLIASVKQYNATNGFWLLILIQITLQVTPTGTASVSIFIDGVASGSGIETTSALPTTISGFLMQNNTFTDNAFHVIQIRVASDNIAHTVSVFSANTAGNGDLVTLMSIADLSSAPPT